MFTVMPCAATSFASVSTILAEAFKGDELTALIKQYGESYASGQNFVSLSLVSDLGKDLR